MRWIGWCGIGYLVLGVLSGCAGAGQRLAARPTFPDNGRGTSQVKTAKAARPSLLGSPRRAVADRTPAGTATATAKASGSEVVGTVGRERDRVARYFPAFAARGDDPRASASASAPPRGPQTARTAPARPTGAPRRGASEPDDSLPPPSDYRAVPEETAQAQAQGSGEPPAPLPVTLTIAVPMGRSAPASPEPAAPTRPDDRAVLDPPAVMPLRPGDVPEFARIEPEVVPASAEIAVAAPSEGEPSPSGTPLAAPAPEPEPPVAVPTPIVEPTPAPVAEPMPTPMPPAPRVAARAEEAGNASPAPPPVPPAPAAPCPPAPAPPPPCPCPTATCFRVPPLPSKQLPGPAPVPAPAPAPAPQLAAAHGVIPPRPPETCRTVTTYWGLGLFKLVKSEEHLHGPACGHFQPPADRKVSEKAPARAVAQQAAPQQQRQLAAPDSMFLPSYYVGGTSGAGVSRAELPILAVRGPEPAAPEPRIQLVSAETTSPAPAPASAPPPASSPMACDPLPCDSDRLVPMPRCRSVAPAPAPAPALSPPAAAPCPVVCPAPRPKRASLLSMLCKRLASDCDCTAAPPPPPCSPQTTTSLRGEPGDVPQGGQPLQRVAAQRGDEPPQR